MKKLVLVLLFLGTMVSCNTTKNELEQFKSNKQIVEKEFSNYHIKSFRNFNYVFQISNPEYVINITLQDHKVVKKDTIKTFNSYAKN